MQKLLSGDAMVASDPVAGMSDRALRRLFDRLMEPRRRARTVRATDVPHLWTLKTMAESAPKRRKEGQGGDRRPDDGLFDQELDHLPPEARWREWMSRVEAVIFAAGEPVTRGVLARAVGKNCSLDLLIDDIPRGTARPALRSGHCHAAVSSPTRPAYADAIRSAFGSGEKTVDLSQSEVLVLMCVAYFQPIARAELSSFFGKEVSRDLIGRLRGAGLIASGPRSPTPNCALHLCDDETIPARIRPRHAARPCPISRRSNAGLHRQHYFVRYVTS